MTDTTTDADTLKYSTPGWSWGAFLFNVIFAAGLRKYWFLLLMLLYTIPFVGALLSLGVMIYFGMKGREMAAESKVFKNKEQYIGCMKGVDHAGKVYFWFLVILIPIAIVGILSSVILVSLAGARERAQEASAFHTAQSLVPLMLLCKDAGGSVDAQIPEAGDEICDSRDMSGKVYPNLPFGWEYGAVRDVGEDGFEYTVSSFDVSKPMRGPSETIVCTEEGCEKEEY